MTYLFLCEDLCFVALLDTVRHVREDLLLRAHHLHDLLVRLKPHGFEDDGYRYVLG